MDLSKIKNVYIVGIEGAGTSALAQLLKHQGIEVSGSDEGDHFYGPILRQAGIKVFTEFNSKNLPAKADLVIYSSAFTPQTNPELKEALRRKLRVLSYAEALGALSRQYFSIAVAGTHGKSTTTAWLAWALQYNKRFPSALVGSQVPQWGSNVLLGYSGLFIFEADEYQNKLKHFHPRALLVNNIDYDHPDFFATFDDYLQAFIRAIKRLPKDGFLIINLDDYCLAKYAAVNCRAKVISYSINNPEADLVAYDCRAVAGKQYFKARFSSFSQNFEAGELGDFCIKLLGTHNIYNSLAVIAASLELGMELQQIRKALEEFEGVERRLQRRGEFRGVEMADDYAHHPTEIRASLEALRQKYLNKFLTVVFHPHTFSRTHAFLKQFSSSFTLADRVIVLEIYGSARESSGAVSSKDLVNAINRHNQQKHIKQEVIYLPTLKDCEKYLRSNLRRGEVAVLMGAGDVFKVGKNLLK